MKKLLITLLILLFVPMFPDAPIDRDEKCYRSFLDKFGQDEETLQFILDRFLQSKEPAIQAMRNRPYFLTAGGALCLVLSAGCYCNMADVNWPEAKRMKNKGMMVFCAAAGVYALVSAYYGATNLDADESDLRSELNRREGIIRERLEEAKKRGTL